MEKSRIDLTSVETALIALLVLQISNVHTNGVPEIGDTNLLITNENVTVQESVDLKEKENLIEYEDEVKKLMSKLTKLKYYSNEEKSHFEKILNRIDALTNLMDNGSIHFATEIGLPLIQSLKIVDLSSDKSIQIQAMDLVEKIKLPVKNWIVEKLGQAICEETPDEEVFDISERITYEMDDGKYFREISGDIVQNYFSQCEETFVGSMLNVTTKMKSVPRIILYAALHDHIMYEKGLQLSFINMLIMLQNGMKTAQEMERLEFKHSTNELWETTPHIKNTAIKRFKNALLNDFYNTKDIDELSSTLKQLDLKMFEDIIKTTVKEVYGKINTLRLISMFRRCREIRESVIGYEAIYDCMKENGELEMTAKNRGALMKLERVVSEAFVMVNLWNIPDSVVLKLLKMRHSLKKLRPQVLSIFKTSVEVGNYTSAEYKQLCEQMFEANTFWSYLYNLVFSLYPKIGTQKLVDFFNYLPAMEQKVVGLAALKSKIPDNSSNDLFVVAENFKILINTKEYKLMYPVFKTTARKCSSSNPPTVRNAVFAREVFIKNLNWGGEYLDCLSFNRSEKSLVSRATWKLSNRAKWVLEYSGRDSIYRIKSAERNEYIFASEDEDFDDSRRVFCEDGRNKTGGEWRFLHSNNGVYIQNVLYQEYLFAGQHIYEENRPIFTWKQARETSNTEWVIEDATLLGTEI